MHHARRWAAAFVVAVVVLAGATASCNSGTLKQNGQACNASSECDVGLLCDLGREPHVCTGEGAPDAAMSIDAATATDGNPGVDARPVDARVLDAPAVDAPPDAAPDAAPDAL